MTNEKLQIINVVIAFIMPIVTAGISAWIAIGKSRQNYEKGIKSFEEDLNNKSHKFTKAYDCEVEVILKICKCCSEIEDNFNSIFPIEAKYCEKVWEEKQSIRVYRSGIYRAAIQLKKYEIELINKHMIEKQEHFESAGGEGVWLNREGKRIFIRELDKKVYQKQTTGKQTLSYDTRIRNEVCNILRYVLYEENYKPYKYY